MKKTNRITRKVVHQLYNVYGYNEAKAIIMSTKSGTQEDREYLLFLLDDYDTMLYYKGKAKK